MGNRYGARADEFAWTLGARRRLARYLQADLTYAECALLLGTTRGSIAGQVHKEGLRMPSEKRRDHQARQSYERAKHGRRGTNKGYWDGRLVESWTERKARLARERNQ